jgi:hypothetical protein
VKRKVPGWKILVGIVVVIAVILGGTWTWAGRVQTRRWADMERRIEEIQGWKKSLPSARPVLRGEPLAGNAWDDYLPAIAGARSAPGRDKLYQFLQRDGKVDRDDVDAIVEDARAHVARLRIGARRAEGRKVFVKGDLQSTNSSVPYAGYLVNFALSRVRLLTERQESRPAMELALDVCQFARDLGSLGGRSNEASACGYLDSALGALRDLIWSGQLSKEDCAELSRELEILDRSFPRHADTLLCDVEDNGIQLREKLPDSLWESPRGERQITAWDARWFLGSTRLMALDCFWTMDDWSRHFQSYDERPWDIVKQEEQAVQEDSRRFRNPLNWGLWGSGYLRIQRAHLRLVSAIAGGRVGGEAPDLDDPFGGKLRRSAPGQPLKFWSVGADGVDDGGSGDWNARTGKDIVLEAFR